MAPLALRSLLLTAFAAVALHTAQAAPAVMGAAPVTAAELRERIEASSALDRPQNIGLMQGVLDGAQAATLNDEQRLWFLDRLSADQLRLRRWQGALDSARRGAALKPSDPAQRLRFTVLQAYAYFGMGQPAEALRLSEETADTVSKLLKGSPDAPGYRRALEAQRLKAMALLALQRRDQSMEVLTDVLRRYDKLEDAEGQAETLHVISSLRDISGDRQEALRTEGLAIELAERGQVKGVLPRLHSFMSYLYGQADQEKDFTRELEAARRSAIAEGDEFILAMTMFNANRLAFDHNRFAEAARLVDEARPIFVRIGDLNMADLCLAARGFALNRLGHREGLELARRADASISQRPGQEVTLVNLQESMAQELAFNHDYEAAYLAQLEYQRRSDALHQADNQKRIAEAEAAYQADRKEQQIEALEHEHVQQKRFRWLWVLVGVLGIAVAVVAAVSRVYLKRAYRAMHEMALEDPLTGLHNRRYLSSRIGEELALARRQRQQGRPPQAGVAFLLIDLDHFKSINDEHGHAAGDAVLRQASTLLRSLVRQSDTLVRWGGEEFLVFAKVSSCDEAGELAERICARMAAHEFDIGAGRTLRRSCSIGFACHPGLSQGAEAAGLASWEGLVSLADECLYKAKASGRDLWVGLRYDVGNETPPEVGAGLSQGDYILHHRAGREVHWTEEAKTETVV